MHQRAIHKHLSLCLFTGVFREREEDDWQRQQVVERWQNAGRSILSSVRMVRNAETLGDKFASGAERYGTPYTHMVGDAVVGHALFGHTFGVLSLSD